MDFEKTHQNKKIVDCDMTFKKKENKNNFIPLKLPSLYTIKA